MKTRIIIYTLCALLGSPGIASANCFADYKAKRTGDQLELHYGVMQLEADCNEELLAATEVETRLAANGWSLLRVMSLFDETQLQDKQENAGDFYLRY